MENEEILQEEDFLILEDENGEKSKFDFLDCIEYEGTEYLLVVPHIEEDEEEPENAGELIILEIEPVDEENENYHSVSDEKILQAVYEIFKAAHSGDFQFAD